jgi:hypothetical protein
MIPIPQLPGEAVDDGSEPAGGAGVPSAGVALIRIQEPAEAVHHRLSRVKTKAFRNGMGNGLGARVCFTNWMVDRSWFMGWEHRFGRMRGELEDFERGFGG